MRDLIDDGVAMHDQRPVIGAVVQKSLADPDKVMLGLPAQIDARTDAGMDEQRLRGQVPQGQRLKPAQMRLGDKAQHLGMGAVVIAVEIDPV